MLRRPPPLTFPPSRAAPGRRPHPALGPLLALGLLLASPSAGAESLSFQPCRLPGVAAELRCATLARPLDIARPEGPSITLHLAVMPAGSRRKREDPVVFLAGGPGQSALGVAHQVLPLLSRLNTQRDLVFVDQRGTGRSAPLRCEEPAGPPPPLIARLDPQAQLPRLRACLAGWSGLPHGDPRFFTTPHATADLEAVREALGAPRLNLVGVSYGTRAALDYLHRHPSRVRRAVLDGVAPPDLALPASQAVDGAAALQAVFAACEADAACRRRHPRLQARVEAWLARPPARLAVRDPLSGRAGVWSPTPEALRTLVRGPLYTPLAAAGLPAALGEALDGRLEGLLGLASLHGAALEGKTGGVAEGPHFAVLCSEDWPRAARQGGALAEPYRSLCPDWPRATLPADQAELPPSPAPVLMLSGGVDPVTPPRHAQRSAQALGAKARHLVAPHHGHGVLATPCGRPLLARFIEAEDEAEALGPALEAGRACLSAMPRPPVYLPPSP